MQSPAITLHLTAAPSNRANPTFVARLRTLLVKAFASRVEAQCRAIARQHVYVGF